jgi:hypothetical protein
MLSAVSRSHLPRSMQAPPGQGKQKLPPPLSPAGELAGGCWTAKRQPCSGDTFVRMVESM